MFILEKEILRLIEEEADNVLKEALSPKAIASIQSIFKGAGKTEDEITRLTSVLSTPGLRNMDAEDLTSLIKGFDISPGAAESIVKKVKGVDAPKPGTALVPTGKQLPARVPPTSTSPGTALVPTGKQLPARVPPTSTSPARSRNVQFFEPKELAVRKVIDLGDGELILPGEAIRRVTDVDLKPEQTQQVLAIVKRSDNLPAVTVADDLANAIDFPGFDKKVALAALTALGVVAGGSIALSNFGKPAAGGAGGEQPTSAAGTSAAGTSAAGTSAAGTSAAGTSAAGTAAAGTAAAGTAGSTGDAGWNKYLRGSKYVTPDQAKQVYDAWIAFVDSQGLKEQAGSLDKSFASFKSWWQTNKTKGNLGRFGSAAETIAYLKAQTKRPKSTVDRGAEAAPAAPAQAQTRPAATSASPTQSVLDKQTAAYSAKLQDIINKYEGMDPEQAIRKSELFKVHPELQKDFKLGSGGARPTVTSGEVVAAAKNAMAKLKASIEKAQKQAGKSAARASKRQGRIAGVQSESTINESVYNRWQKIIKG